jgi:CubicO group peptidase (beta-lactamase class C family)
VSVVRDRILDGLALALAATGWASCSRADDAAVDDDGAAPACRTDLTGELGRLKVPGLSAAIVVDGRIACTAVAGQADIEAGRAVRPDTVFAWASRSPSVSSSPTPLRSATTGPSTTSPT